MDKKLCEYIDGSRESFLSDIKRLVDIKSVREAPLPGKPFGEGAAAVLVEASAIASEHGFCMRNFDNYAGEIQFGDTPELMLLAHLDVVSEGDNWTREPYRMSTEGDRIYGRGTTDDKGAAIACLYALDAVRAVYGKPDTGVRLVFGCGEETGSEDMEHYFAEREVLKYTLSPDADYPVINLEKGRFAPEFAKDIQAPGNILEINGGVTANIVPGKANALVKGITAEYAEGFLGDVAGVTGAEFKAEDANGGVRIYCCGSSAHAASPEKGNNANTALLMLLIKLADNGEMKTALYDLLCLFPHGDTSGRVCGVEMSDERSGALTLNFGILGFDGKTLHGGLDLRCPLCADEKNVKGVIKNKLCERGFSFIGDPQMRAVHYVPEDAPIVREVLAVYEDHTGKKGECLAIGGGTYVHDIEGGVAFGIEFPGTDYRIHGADEFAVTDELLLTAKMYAQIIRDLTFSGADM